MSDFIKAMLKINKIGVIWREGITIPIKIKAIDARFSFGRTELLCQPIDTKIINKVWVTFENIQWLDDDEKGENKDEKT